MLEKLFLYNLVSTIVFPDNFLRTAHATATIQVPKLTFLRRDIYLLRPQQSYHSFNDKR